MITKRQFDKAKEFRPQASCPFCVLERPNGLYWVALDQNNDFLDLATLQQRIIDECSRRHYSGQIAEEYIRAELSRSKTDNYAFHCKDCNNYWISNQRLVSFNDIFHTARYLLPDTNITADKATDLFAKSAVDYFVCTYGKSREFERVITSYSEYRVHADVTILTGGERSREIEMPLNQFATEITDFLFESLKASLLHKYYGRTFLQLRMQEKYTDEQWGEIVNKKVLDMLMLNGFLDHFLNLLKTKFAFFVRKYYPNPAAFILDNPEHEAGHSNELLGRCISKIFGVMYAFGLGISTADKDKLIFGSLKILSQGGDFEMVNMMVMEECSVIIT